MERNSRIFDIDGEKYRFDNGAFNAHFDRESERLNMTLSGYEDVVAQKAYVTGDAVHNWRLGRNGPHDLKTVINAAEVLGCDVFSLLVKTGTNSLKPLGERQIQAFKRIYDEIQKLLIFLELTKGGARILEFSETEKEGAEKCLCEIHDALNKVTLRFILEYFDLGQTELYDEISGLWNSFLSSYDESVKCVNDYFVADLEYDSDALSADVKETLEESLCFARTFDGKVTELLEKYIW